MLRVRLFCDAILRFSRICSSGMKLAAETSSRYLQGLAGACFRVLRTFSRTCSRTCCRVCSRTCFASVALSKVSFFARFWTPDFQLSALFVFSIPLACCAVIAGAGVPTLRVQGDGLFCSVFLSDFLV